MPRLYPTSIVRQRELGIVTGHRLEVLRLMQRTNGGPVTEELVRYQLWRRHGRKEPEIVHYNFTHLKTITGLGIRRVDNAGWMLAPELNEPWCVPQRWIDG